MNMHNLFEAQQTPEAVNLLAAQKQAYIEGKRYNTIILAGYILMGIMIPVVGVFLVDEKWLGLVSGMLGLVLAFPLSSLVSKKAETGATIQEEFDFHTYGWDWAASAAGLKINDFQKKRLSRKLKDWSNLKADGRDGTEIKPWYSDYSSLPQSQAILSCQSENLYWDSTQKKKYANLLAIVGIFFFALAFGAFFLPGVTPMEALQKVVFPILGVLIYLAVSVNQILRTSYKLDSLFPLAQKMRDTYAKKGEAIPTEDLQEIQKTIFSLRKEGYLIPEWFYNWQKKDIEVDIPGK